MSIDYSSKADVKISRVTCEQPYLRWLGVPGMISVSCMILVIIIATFPYPDNNLKGNIYLGYVLPSHTGEWQDILGITAISIGILFFLLLLAMSYMALEGRLMFSSLVIIATASAYAAVQTATAGLYIVMPMLARGYPSFGSDPIDYKLVTLLWDATNAFWTMGGFFLGLSWIAIFFANRRHSVIPRALGGWCALVVTVVNFGSLFSFFVPTGPWSPASWACFLVQSGVTWLWITIVSAFFLIRAFAELWQGRRLPKGRFLERMRSTSRYHAQ